MKPIFLVGEAVEIVMDWYNMDRPEKMRMIKDLTSQGLSSKQIAEHCRTHAKRIQDFMRTWKIKGLGRGAQEGNTNAQFHGESLNKNRRLMREAITNNGRSLNICERCSWTEGQNLPIHHKDRDHFNNEPSNLEVLCHECHAKEHQHDRLRNIFGQFL